VIQQLCLQLLHLIRDPRGVSLSRKSDASFRSVNSEYTLNGNSYYDIVREAALYCDSVLFDLHIRQRLEQRYPDRVQQIVFEQFVQDPVQSTQNIYKFLGEDIPVPVTNWLRIHTTRSQSIAVKWQHAMNGTDVWHQIYEHPMCRQLYARMVDTWKPYTRSV